MAADSRIYSYKIARDFGFAPNPFFGFCTLATCKPEIRRNASVGDWVLGCGAVSNQLENHLIMAMKITETMTFDEYWNDERFIRKKPYLSGSLKQAFGDNIYHGIDNPGGPVQVNSHHTLRDGSPNEQNIKTDTRVNRVLISSDFAYFGCSAVVLPNNFAPGGEYDIAAPRFQGHKCKFPRKSIAEFDTWFRNLGASGLIDKPVEWTKPSVRSHWNE